MKAYLCGRKQRVKIDNTFSQWKAVRSGVPQGGLLGPLLFNIYMNGLNHFVLGSSLRLYADDTTAYASDTSPLVLEYIINSDLQSGCKWFENNYLNINTTKTQAMAIGPINNEYNINLHNSNIECFHSRDEHLCKFIGTKESVCIRKEFNSHRTGLGHQHGRRFIVLGHQYGRHDVT